MSLDRMGAEQPVALDKEVGPFATVAIDAAARLGKKKLVGISMVTGLSLAALIIQTGRQ